MERMSSVVAARKQRESIARETIALVTRESLPRRVDDDHRSREDVSSYPTWRGITKESRFEGNSFIIGGKKKLKEETVSDTSMIDKIQAPRGKCFLRQGSENRFATFGHRTRTSYGAVG
ncbi:hypothetical protein KPH14_004171 [Odynerus spinipes]|uniref:Uncharacterized protein n=1 Tax=Odynerus spinipes TaxID=1348599 RepID=A0AAD9RY90_9HYME|nr:hypothetical protein KPH14_004171 [Odynerus spinipes]